MKAGDTIEIPVQLWEQDGTPRSYADTAAFQAGGWDITVDIDQVTTAVTYTVEDKGAGLHIIRFTVVEGDYLIELTVPGTDVASASAFVAYIDSVDASDIYAAVNSGGELTPIQQNLSDQDIGNIVHGDAWGTGQLTVPLSRLTPIGLTDLTGGTLSASFKDAPDGTEVSVATATIDDAANRIVSVGFDTFPAAMNLTGSELQKTWYLDIQFKHTASGKIITVARYSVNVVWQRDTTT